MPSGSFSLNAWVIAGRHRHDRLNDHFGVETDLNVITTDAIGPWPAGTPLHYVLSDLYAMQVARDSMDNHQVRVFYLDAWVLAPTTAASGGLGVFTLDALVKKTVSHSFTFDALVIRGGSFTLDAWVAGYGSFTLNAWVA